MPKKIDYQQAVELFKTREDLVLIESGFNGWAKNSEILDKTINEIFFAQPGVVLRTKANHPKVGRQKSAKSRSLDFKSAFERFKSQRTDIILLEEGYLGWEKKARFFDIVENAEFIAKPKKVFIRLSCHPNRSAMNRKEKLKLNVNEAFERFNNQRTDLVLIKDTYKKWSTKAQFLDTVVNDYFWSIPNDVYKHKTVHPSRRQEKQEQTSMKNWGVKNFSQTQDFKNMHRELSKKNEESVNHSKRYLAGTDIHLKDWHESQPEPKPAYSALKRLIPNETITYDSLEKMLVDYRNNITSLESTAAKLFESEHYGKKPKSLAAFIKPDFKLSETIYVNVDGLYWHSDKVKDDKWCHFNQRKEFETAGLRLFQFREDEIKNKPNVVLSIINNSLGKSQNRIHARNCSIQIVEHSVAVEFLDNNHLMGKPAPSKHIGLFYQNELVCLLSYKCKSNICKIERFCSKVNTVIPGGFSKLLSDLEKNHLPEEITEIHNWVDLRYGTGNHLLSKGFIQTKETLGWKWTDLEKTYNRLHCKANMDARKLTEKQHAEELGLFRIYDAGQRLYQKSINNSRTI